MKALVLEAPGDEPSLALRDVAVPTAGPHDVLVEVAACGLCHHDVAVMRGLLRRGVKQGIILGHEISGRVVEIGDSVSSVEVGDGVVSTLTTFCGECQRCLHGMEYRCLHGRGVGHSIDGGFAQVHDDTLTVVTDRAVPAESVSLEEGEAELAEANARVSQSGEDQAAVTADQRRAMAKIALAKRL